LAQGFKSNDFEIQTKDNLDSNERIFTSKNLNSTQGFEFKEDLNLFRDENLTRKTLKSFRKPEVNFGSEMKFESNDLNSNQRCLNSRQGFNLKESPNSEKFKPFQNRKF
jgi:hypothetical protein